MTEKNFDIRCLSPKDLNVMYFSFLDAFGSYPIPFRLNKEQFVRKFVQKLKISFPLSAGAFDYDAMAGFILTSVCTYNGKLTAYNGGTGVRPSFRGNRLTSRMYDFLIPRFKEHGVKQCILEVLIGNSFAIKAYESIGFKKECILSCFKLQEEMPYKKLAADNLEIRKISKPNWILYEEFQDFHTSYLDSTEMINQNLLNEDFIEARIDEEILGYAIYQPGFGRLSQLAVKTCRRRQGIGSAIMRYILSTSRNKELTVINVNEDDVALIKFLEALKFQNHLNQYEMRMQLI